MALRAVLQSLVVLVWFVLSKLLKIDQQPLYFVRVRFCFVQVVRRTPQMTTPPLQPPLVPPSTRTRKTSKEGMSAATATTARRLPPSLVRTPPKTWRSLPTRHCCRQLQHVMGAVISGEESGGQWTVVPAGLVEVLEVR